MVLIYLTLIPKGKIWPSPRMQRKLVEHPREVDFSHEAPRGKDVKPVLHSNVRQSPREEVIVDATR